MVMSTIENGEIVPGVEVGNAAYADDSWCHPTKIQLYGTIYKEGGLPPKSFEETIADNIAEGLMDAVVKSGVGNACEGSESELCKSGVGVINSAYDKVKAEKAAREAEEAAQKDTGPKYPQGTDGYMIMTTTRLGNTLAAGNTATMCMQLHGKYDMNGLC